MALPEKSEGKNYVEVVVKVVDGKWPIREVSQPAAVASSAQPASEAKKGEETESENE